MCPAAGSAPEHRLLTEALDGLNAAADTGAGDAELLSVLTLCEGASRRLDQLAVTTLATLQRRGAFAERGYNNTTSALVRPARLGTVTRMRSGVSYWARHEARRRVTAAEQVCPRVGLDGAALPAKLPATAQVFAAGQAGLRHVEAIAQVLASAAATRLTPEVWTGAEAQLAVKAGEYSPSGLLTWGTALVEALDQDGAEPDERPPALVNELHLRRHHGAPGGTLKARFDDPAMYDAIATVIDAHAKPLTSDDERTPTQRQAEALADVCGYVLDHANIPECGGRRPHLNVHVRLEDLENRARAAMLAILRGLSGGTLSPESLRMLACDAAVVPIVMSGTGQPLDVGRATRVIPDGLRRAVAARDGGCARCGRPPSWCEVHHILAWEDGGETKLANCTMLCRACHRLVHHAGWDVRLHDGHPEFYPPAWIDPERRPRRRPLPHLPDVA